MQNGEGGLSGEEQENAMERAGRGAVACNNIGACLNLMLQRSPTKLPDATTPLFGMCNEVSAVIGSWTCGVMHVNLA
jgi:hypothetical protein